MRRVELAALLLTRRDMLELITGQVARGVVARNLIGELEVHTAHTVLLCGSYSNVYFLDQCVEVERQCHLAGSPWGPVRQSLLHPDPSRHPQR